MAAVRGTQHPLDTSLISSTENPNTVKYLQDNGCNSGSLGFGGWYTISKALLIRMNFGTVNSINEELKLNYNIYPNPSDGKFTIDNLTNDTYDLIVNNIYGQQVLLEKQINNVKKEIDLGFLSKGIYIIEIKNDNNNFTHKLLLE